MHCFIIAALSADGFLSENDQTTYNQKDGEGAVTLGRKTFWTSKEDGLFFRERTKQAGLVIMGRKTFELTGRPLPGRTTVVYSTQTPEEELPENLHYTQDDPAVLLKKLEQEGFSEVAVCGGSTIYTQFMQAGVVDTLYLTVEPLLFGRGISLFNHSLGGVKLELKEVKNLSSQTLLLEYSVIKV